MRWIHLPRDSLGYASGAMAIPTGHEEAELRTRVLEEIDDYRSKAEILRQIHSNKAFRYQKRDAIQKVTTLVLTAFLTFLGFTGLAKLEQLLALTGIPVNASVVEFVFNLLIFLVLVAVLMSIVLGFQDQAATHNRSIVMLTGFIRDAKDSARVGDFGSEQASLVLAGFRERYKTMTEALPPSTDAEYIRSKQDYAAKKQRGHGFEALGIQTALAAGSESDRLKALRRMVEGDPDLMAALRALKAGTEVECWITGGAVRSLVWSELHQYPSKLREADVDVIYFDRADTTELRERQLEDLLRKAEPSIQWSVKNQARMHNRTGDQPFADIADAVSKFPETASAVAVRLADGDLQVLAPLGLGDLFNLVVRPSPHFYRHPERYEERLREGHWVEKFPRLIVFHLEPTAGEEPGPPPVADHREATPTKAPPRQTD